MQDEEAKKGDILSIIKDRRRDREKEKDRYTERDKGIERDKLSFRG